MYLRRRDSPKGDPEKPGMDVERGDEKHPGTPAAYPALTLAQARPR